MVNSGLKPSECSGSLPAPSVDEPLRCGTICEANSPPIVRKFDSSSDRELCD
jgi:hypothetical protein